MKKAINEWIGNPLFLWSVPFFCLGVLIYLAFINATTPFRGEHWAMLYAWVNSPTLPEKIRNIVNIEYFGDHRFQPLNSLPMMLQYLIWGTDFLPSYLISILIHIFFSIGVLRVLETVRGHQAKDWISLAKTYPLELGLLLVFFPFYDVISWTYFHYIQLAITLSLFSLHLVLSSSPILDLKKTRAFALIVPAVFMYEPMLIVLILELGFCFLQYLKRPNQKRDLFYLVPIFFVAALTALFVSHKVSEPITVPPNVSVLNEIPLMTGHDLLFQTPFATNKILFCIYNITLVILNTLRSSFFPAYANKTNLYELFPVQKFLGPHLIWATLILVGITLVLFFSILKHRERFRFPLLSYSILGSAFLGIFTVICLGRPGAGHYASVQFRYAFVSIPFLIILTLDLVYRIDSKSYLQKALLFLIAINVGNTLNQGMRLKDNFSLFSGFVTNLKSKGADSAEVVNLTAKAIHDYSIRIPGHDVFLIYNGRGGLNRFYGKM